MGRHSLGGVWGEVTKSAKRATAKAGDVQEILGVMGVMGVNVAARRRGWRTGDDNQASLGVVK